MVSARRKDSCHTIVAAEPLGLEGLDSLKSGLTQALDAGRGEIIIDMSEAAGIDGACLSTILWAARTLPAERPLSVIVGPDLARSFAEWRVDTVIGIVESESDPAAQPPGRE